MSLLTQSVIEATLQNFVEKWNRGARHEVLDMYSEDASFIEAGACVHGRKAIVAHYLDKYPNTEAMGELLSLDLIEFRPARPDGGFAREQATMALALVRYTLQERSGAIHMGTELLVFERNRQEIFIVMEVMLPDRV